MPRSSSIAQCPRPQGERGKRTRRWVPEVTEGGISPQSHRGRQAERRQTYWGFPFLYPLRFFAAGLPPKGLISSGRMSARGAHFSVGVRNAGSYDWFGDQHLKNQNPPSSEQALNPHPCVPSRAFARCFAKGRAGGAPFRGADVADTRSFDQQWPSGRCKVIIQASRKGTPRHAKGRD